MMHRVFIASGILCVVFAQGEPKDDMMTGVDDAKADISLSEMPTHFFAPGDIGGFQDEDSMQNLVNYDEKDMINLQKKEQSKKTSSAKTKNGAFMTQFGDVTKSNPFLLSISGLSGMAFACIVFFAKRKSQNVQLDRSLLG